MHPENQEQSSSRCSPHSVQLVPRTQHLLNEHCENDYICNSKNCEASHKTNIGSIFYELINRKLTALQNKCIFTATFSSEMACGILIKI